MGNKRKNQKSFEPISKYDGDSSESGRSRDPSQIPEKKNCNHINKAVVQNDIAKHFKTSTNQLKCNEEVNCDSEDLFVCLRCGKSVCANKHAQVHEQKPRSDSHCMMVDTTKWTVWCYKCNSFIPVDTNKKLKSTVDYVRTHHGKDTANSSTSVVIPLSLPLPSSNQKDEKRLNNTSANMKRNIPTTIASNKIRGLANLGNTCFMNSVLQCLAQTPSLIEYLNELKNEVEVTIPSIEEGEQKLVVKLSGWGRLTQELAHTLSEINSSSGSVYSPRPLLDQIRKKCSQFDGYDQHDAHELLRELLNAVRNEDLKRYQKVILMKLFNSTNFKPEDLNEEEKIKAKRWNHKISDLISTKPINLFKGQTVCLHQCEDCNHISTKTEPFMDLSLPVLREKSQPPNSKRNREDSTSEEPKLSKHQLKKQAKNKRKGKGKGRNNTNWQNNDSTTVPNTDLDWNESVPGPISEEVDEGNSNRRDNSPASSKYLIQPRSSPILHTAELFMETCGNSPDMNHSFRNVTSDDKITGKKNNVASSQSEYSSDIQIGELFSDDEITKLCDEENPIEMNEVTEPICNITDSFGELNIGHLTPESNFAEIDGKKNHVPEHLNSNLKVEIRSIEPYNSIEPCISNIDYQIDNRDNTSNYTTTENVPSSSESPMNCTDFGSEPNFNVTNKCEANVEYDLVADFEPLNINSNAIIQKVNLSNVNFKENELEGINDVTTTDFNNSSFNYESISCEPIENFSSNKCDHESHIKCLVTSDSLNHRTNDISHQVEPTDMIQSAVNDESKERYHLTKDDWSNSDVCSTRSSSLFQESGFCSHSIDEVSSTHPSEGMCSTESCNGGNYGDEFNVEHKTSIPESDIGSMTEEMAINSIVESDNESNASPDSMHANRSPGSNPTLSPFSDDSSQRKNDRRSCNSLSNSSREDPSFYNQEHLNPNSHHLDHDYIKEKLIGRLSPQSGSLSPDREEQNEIEENEREEEDEEEDDEVLSPLDDTGDPSKFSVENRSTLLPRTPRIEGECSLSSCLNQYTSIEMLAGINCVTCETCTRNQNRGSNKTEPAKTPATLQTLIVTPPAVLICHLKRFQMTYSSLKKITKMVSFPTTLSIGSFCSNKCQGVKEGETDVQYSLYGVVEHSGSLHGGHYVAYVKASCGQWYYASDSRVSPVTLDRVLKSEAYLLFYHRT